MTPIRRSRLPIRYRLLVIGLLLLGLLFSGARTARADSWHYGVIWGADWVDLSHLGIHTHMNNIGFNLRRLNMNRPSQIQVRAHCQLTTWVPGWGSIENWRIERPGDYAVVIAPSRFAIAAYLSPQWGAYSDRWPYYLEVWWYGP